MSKEEIEDFKIKAINTIKKNNEIISDSMTPLTEQEYLLKANNIIDNALQYIEQLENKLKESEERDKKLINKLEKDVENSDKGLGTNILLIKEYYKNKK